MNKILLQCDNLCKRYQEGSVQTDVLHNVSFSVGEGEMMAIVGSSGSGKSTLLHLLGGLDTPTSGDVIFNGQPMSKLSSAAKAELRNQKLGFIYQFHHLLPNASAWRLPVRWSITRVWYWRMNLPVTLMRVTPTASSSCLGS